MDCLDEREVRHERITVLVLALGMLFGMLGGAAVTADDHLQGHGHILLLKVEGEFPATLTYHRCVDLAAGQPVPLHAHHDHMHDEDGSASIALTKAGHAVAPTAPLVQFWSDCATFAAFLKAAQG